MLSQFTQPEGSDKSTLAAFDFPPNVYSIGRLDYDSEGLILLSDDTSLNQALLNPDAGHQRTYWSQVENIPNERAIAELAAGPEIEGRKTMACQARMIDEPQLPPRPVPVRFRKNIPTAWIELILTEGKNRQVRKMTAAIGHPTLRLVRVAIGRLTLADLGLQPGQWVRLTNEQLLRAFQ